MKFQAIAKFKLPTHSKSYVNYPVKGRCLCLPILRAFQSGYVISPVASFRGEERSLTMTEMPLRWCHPYVSGQSGLPFFKFVTYLSGSWYRTPPGRVVFVPGGGGGRGSTCRLSDNTVSWHDCIVPCPYPPHHIIHFHGAGGWTRMRGVFCYCCACGWPAHTMKTDYINPGWGFRRGQKSCFCPELLHLSPPAMMLQSW